MALSDGVQKDIAMCKMQCALQKTIHPMYFQYAKIMRIFQKYNRQTGASGNINPMNKRIIDVFSPLKHVEADILGSSSGSRIFNWGNEITVTKLLLLVRSTCEIRKFKKKKILEKDEDDSNDQRSDAEATGNEENINNCLICFSSVVQKVHHPR